MPASKSRKGSRWQVCPVCRQIKGRDGYHEDAKKPNGMASWCISCTRDRQYQEWRRQRRQQNRAKEPRLRERGRKLKNARRLYREGVWQEEIARRTGLPRVAISRFIADLKPDRNTEIARLYAEEQASMEWLAQHFDLTRQRIAEILKAQGVEVRTQGWHLRGDEADRPTIGQILRAIQDKRVTPRAQLPKGGNIHGALTQKGFVLMEILRAAPAPLSTKQVSFVGQGLKVRWSTHMAATRDALVRLERHGFVGSDPKLLVGPWGRRVRGWFIAADLEERARGVKVAPPSAEEINRQIQIRRLLEQQQTEDDDRVGRSRSVSLDAPLTDSGFTILDTLGDEDEALAELVGEAA